MTPTWITAIESGIGLPLPDALRARYELLDGEIATDRPFRLMRSDEVAAEWEACRQMANLRGLCPFWVGWNHDHAALYLQGPLVGRICIWDHVHNYPHESVAYRSVESFLQSMDAAAHEELDWYEMPTDYYVETSYYFHGAAVSKPAGPADIESDRRALAHLRNEYAAATIEDEFDEWYFAFNIMGLTPLADTDSILGFLDAEDMYVQERACAILGHRKFAPAVEPLAHLAAHGKGNGQTAALAALGKIGTHDALEAIVRSIGRFEKGLHWLIAKALEGCGCRVRWQDDKFRMRHYEYQLPHSDLWHKLQ